MKGGLIGLKNAFFVFLRFLYNLASMKSNKYTLKNWFSTWRFCRFNPVVNIKVEIWIPNPTYEHKLHIIMHKL